MNFAIFLFLMAKINNLFETTKKLTEDYCKKETDTSKRAS